MSSPDYDIKVSPATIKTSLNQSQIKCYQTPIKPVLDKFTREERYQFALKYLKKLREWWRNVCFSDEAYFNIGEYCYHSTVWRHKGEKYLPGNVKLIEKHPKSFMAWG